MTGQQHQLAIRQPAAGELPRTGQLAERDERRQPLAGIRVEVDAIAMSCYRRARATRWVLCSETGARLSPARLPKLSAIDVAGEPTGRLVGATPLVRRRRLRAGGRRTPRRTCVPS